MTLNCFGLHVAVFAFLAGTKTHSPMLYIARLRSNAVWLVAIDHPLLPMRIHTSGE